MQWIWLPVRLWSCFLFINHFGQTVRGTFQDTSSSSENQTDNELVSHTRGPSNCLDWLINVSVTQKFKVKKKTWIDCFFFFPV